MVFFINNFKMFSGVFPWLLTSLNVKLATDLPYMSVGNCRLLLNNCQRGLIAYLIIQLWGEAKKLKLKSSAFTSIIFSFHQSGSFFLLRKLLFSINSWTWSEFPFHFGAHLLCQVRDISPLGNVQETQERKQITIYSQWKLLSGKQQPNESHSII